MPPANTGGFMRINRLCVFGSCGASTGASTAIATMTKRIARPMAPLLRPRIRRSADFLYQAENLDDAGIELADELI
ncbi:hypothetical protein CRBSH125_23000 [Afipia carboxidovorans]|nr:hypothetical protein CRBSH125_23000 [Afipia carboxidovorans]